MKLSLYSHGGQNDVLALKKTLPLKSVNNLRDISFFNINQAMLLKNNSQLTIPYLYSILDATASYK